ELGVASAKGIFKHLVKYPEAITHFSDFLYHKVPEILRASERFLSIKEDKLSTEEITLATNGILSTIRVLSESITDDYERLVSEASEEIALSKKLVERKNG
ncbi:TPA: 5-bromo-4-chloroindolyl phosphate hydrolysis family protein, partial [Enterococcus faecalis]|nr:5-bromo-4-chloroindolyl phosphate hydrolysis family protein [Enterococcus faecalis]